MPKNGCFSSRRFHGIQDKKKRKEVATTMSLFPLIKKRKKKSLSQKLLPISQWPSVAVRRLGK